MLCPTYFICLAPIQTVTWRPSPGTITRPSSTSPGTFCSQLDNASKKDIVSKLRLFRLGKRRKDSGKRAQPVVRLENGEIAATPKEAQAGLPCVAYTQRV